MAVGNHAVNYLNKVLNHLTGAAAWTAPTGLYAQLHTGDPGAAGTANPSAVTSRRQLGFAAASNGAIVQTGPIPAWTMTTTETITHYSVWDASTAGSFLWSVPLTTPLSVVLGNEFTLPTYGYAFGPVAV